MQGSGSHSPVMGFLVGGGGRRAHLPLPSQALLEQTGRGGALGREPRVAVE